MFYAIYLVGTIIWILMNIGGGFRNPINFMDSATAMFILVPCILILVCTRSLKAFGRAFLFAFGHRGDSVAAYKESLLAVKMVIQASGLFGSLGFLIGMYVSIRSLEDFSSAESLGWILLDLPVAMISFFYLLLIWILLLPICFILKKYVENQ